MARSHIDRNLALFETFAKELPDRELGQLVRDYVVDSNHNGWDGHPRADQRAYSKLFRDMMTFYEKALYKR